ncbi:HNH endonuclease signature motif containing protein [Microbacterium hibisci]|uniref:HNH endonuclease signature motif containing protein n=1 Tax=Microbacterium hibisci TaxID=2036000 RepID=UPI0019408880|nr:HNH endonuclease signature motif containing protein [Microbacterium hibisci]
MTNLGAALADLGDALAGVVAAALDDGLRACDDADVLSALAVASHIQRGAEAIMVEAVAQLRDRDDLRVHPDRATTRYGCRNLGELVQRATRVSGRSAADLITAAVAVQRSTAPSTGEVLPPSFPGMRGALAAGQVGVDAVVAVASAFRRGGVGRADLLAADEELAAAACGDGPDAAGPVTADELRALAQVWAAYLDPDGAEPVEARALRKRGLSVGRRDGDGLVPVRGHLLPEVAAQLQLGFDSVLNPRGDGAPVIGPCFTEVRAGATIDGSAGEAGAGADADPSAPSEASADSRTRTQKQHDALAVLLTAAAASGELPTLGGAAPTLVVSVREEDLATGRGYAHLPGDDEPISITAARHVACAGAVQRVVLGDDGRIVSLVTLDRVFNHHQRRAITVRDGGCLIPGCQVPPQWCEIHHVEEYSRGGPTHTDNGVLLCWFHHRTIDTGGWQVAMIGGVPYVKGPYWWDAEVKWRPATKSPTRLSDRLRARSPGR